MDGAAQKFAGWRMVALAFAANNLSLGMTGGAYGPVVHSLEQRFDISRGQASSGMGVLLLVMALSSPIVAHFATRFSLRKIMITGAVLQGAGYFLLALATDYTQMLACFALTGLGECMLGIISPVTLVSRWFEGDRGKALGFLNIPLMLFLAPLITARFVPTYGSVGVFLVEGCMFAALIPLLFLVVDRPAQIGQVPWKGNGVVAERPVLAAANTGTLLSARNIFGAWQFWMLTLGFGLMTSSGVVFVVHSVSFATQKGLSLQTASFLLSAYGLAGIFGTPLCGWLSDKIGAVRALIVTACILAVVWTGLLLTDNMLVMLAMAGVIGSFTNAAFAMHGSAVNEIFGPNNVPKVIGLTYFVKLPFLFGAPPLAGYLYDLTGGYDLPFKLHIVSFFVVATMFTLVARYQVRALRQAQAG